MRATLTLLACLALICVVYGKECPVCKSFASDLCGHAKNPIETAACKAIEGVCDFFVCPADEVVDHLPFEDHDGDRYSLMFGLRGNAWRGKDCDDLNANVYPGRAQDVLKNPDHDYNCNGIFGANKTGTYEDQFCKNSGQLGTIILGDSLSTHFGPPIYPFGTVAQWETNLELETDWPDCGWGTGHMNFSVCPVGNASPGLGYINSVYQQMWERNRCNFRDYQTIAVDGARSSSMARDIMNTTARHTDTDIPATVFFAIGANDVCNPHPGNGSFTTPEEFIANNMVTLNWLDAHLPAGSHLVFVGIYPGHIIWDCMHNQTYPYFGITYEELWHELTDHWTGGGDNRTLSPCWGWLNPNETWRNYTSEYAVKLQNTWQQVMATYKPVNFDMMYIDHPAQQVYDTWVGAGHECSALFEAVGGAHPSTTATTLWSEVVFNYLVANHPEVIGPENPFNAEIAAKFGNQGGYGG